MGRKRLHQQRCCDSVLVTPQQEQTNNRSNQQRHDLVSPSEGQMLGKYPVVRQSSILTDDNPFQRNANRHELRRETSKNHNRRNSTSIQTSSLFQHSDLMAFIRNIQCLRQCLDDFDERLERMVEVFPKGISKKPVNGADIMDWQPELVVIIPQVEDVRYCWDGETESSTSDIEGDWAPRKGLCHW